MLRLALAWVLAAPSERGRYLTPLSKAARRMLAAGVEPPNPAQVERDIEAVMSGAKRAQIGRERKPKTR